MHVQARRPRVSGAIGSQKRMDSPSEPWEGTNPSNTLISDLWPPEPWENTFILFQLLCPVICYGSPGKLVHRVRPRESSAHIHWSKRAHVASCNCKSGKQSLAVCQESTCIHEPEDSLPSSKNQLPRDWAARTSQTRATGWIRLGQPLRPPRKPGRCHSHSQWEVLAPPSRGHSCPL